MRIVVVINKELGWDNVVCMADSLESAAFEMEFETVEDLKKYVEEDDDIILSWSEVSTLPEKTLKESIQKHWR